MPQPKTVPQILALALFKRLGRRPTLEYRFSKFRRWRFDLCYVRQKLAIEVDGTRHASISANRKDAEKRNAAIQAGWKVLTFPASSVTTKMRLPLIVNQIEQVLSGVDSPEEAAHVLTG